jgi:hypothetical protein
MKVYKVQVEQLRGKNAGKVHFLVIRAGVDGKITVPRGYKLIAIMEELWSTYLAAFATRLEITFESGLSWKRQMFTRLCNGKW